MMTDLLARCPGGCCGGDAGSAPWLQGSAACRMETGAQQQLYAAGMCGQRAGCSVCKATQHGRRSSLLLSVMQLRAGHACIFSFLC